MLSLKILNRRRQNEFNIIYTFLNETQGNIGILEFPFLQQRQKPENQWKEYIYLYFHNYKGKHSKVM